MRPIKKNAYPGVRHEEDDKELGHFNVYPRASCPFRVVPYNRRDYFKISLIIGTGLLNYRDKAIEINQNALLFSNPNIPCSWEAISEKQEGYSCLFTGEFLNGNDSRIKSSDSPPFKIGIKPILFINGSQTRYLERIFLNMLEEMASDCACKYDLNPVTRKVSPPINFVHRFCRMNQATTAPYVRLAEEFMECKISGKSGFRLPNRRYPECRRWIRRLIPAMLVHFN